MRFTWDPAKAAANRVKHGISFEVAELVFDDPHHIARIDRFSIGEERWIAIGAVGTLLLAVVHLYIGSDDEIVRIISARRASPQERREYRAAS